MAVSYGYDPTKRTYYGTKSDIELAKQAGTQGNFYDVSSYGDETKYKDILHAYKTGANPVILGGEGATGGINDNIYKRLLDSGVQNLTRIGGKDRNEVQNNLKSYVSQMKQNKPFEFNYQAMNYDQAQNQASQQLDPMYQRALENIKAQKYQNELSAGEQAQSRGLSHSGLAADLQNKVAIAAQGQVADTEAQRASQLAEMSQALMQRDQDRELQLRQQAYQEYMSGKQMDLQYDQFDRQQQQYADEKAWREYAFNNMSASEKQQLEWAKQTYGEDAAWKMFELKYNGELAKSQAQAELASYSGFNGAEGGGEPTNISFNDNQYKNYSGYASFKNHMAEAVRQGVDPAWVPLLSEIIKRESSFNPKADNPTSTAYGYGQFLDSTRKTYEAKTGLNYDNPVHQLIMMAQYVKDRYKTPAAALDFWNRKHWY